jgi:hypothetical protein
MGVRKGEMGDGRWDNSLPFIRGGLGWGNTDYAATQITYVYVVGLIREGFGWGKGLPNLANIFFENTIAIGVTEFAESFSFNLANPFAGDIKNLTDFF